MKKELSLKERLELIKKSTLKVNTQKLTNVEKIPDINTRLKKILQITADKKQNKFKMFFFVMYDISDDRVRNEIAKYLLRNGCVRIQKSIFFASAPRQTYQKLHTDLKEVQQSYENDDSIIFVPVSSDEVRSMKIIGKNIDFDIITGSANSLFF